jgi:hypothetical protein
MTGAKTLPGVTMEVFMVEQEIAPVWIGGKMPLCSMTRATTILPRQKEAHETQGEFARYGAEVHELARTCGTFDLQRVTVKVVIAFEGFDQEIVHWKPDGSTPIGIAAEHINI